MWRIVGIFWGIILRGVSCSLLDELRNCIDIDDLDKKVLVNFIGLMDQG